MIRSMIIEHSQTNKQTEGQAWFTHIEFYFHFVKNIFVNLCNTMAVSSTSAGERTGLP
jgi:hypothetical protein